MASRLRGAARGAGDRVAAQLSAPGARQGWTMPAASATAAAMSAALVVLESKARSAGIPAVTLA